MSFLKIFKGKKIKLERKPERGGKRKVGGVVRAPKKEAKVVEKEPAIKPEQKPKRGKVKIAPQVLKSPQITEKASFLQNQNQYVFKVFQGATKPEIKKSLEEVYGVNVLKVRIVNVPRKRKRLGRTSGWKKGYKKAIVKIKKGQTIEVLPR